MLLLSDAGSQNLPVCSPANYENPRLWAEVAAGADAGPDAAASESGMQTADSAPTDVADTAPGGRLSMVGKRLQQCVQLMLVWLQGCHTPFKVVHNPQN